jgi:hypothetical protein
MGIVFAMDTTTASHDKPKKKRGPAKKLVPMVDTHIHVPPYLLDWAKVQPEGFAGLVRRLLKQEHARDTTP